MVSEAEMAIGLVTIGVMVVTAAVAAAWKVGQSENRISATAAMRSDELKHHVDMKLDAIARDQVSNHREIQSSFGEGLTAIRQKVHDNELRSERDFLRREDFLAWQYTLQKQIDRMETMVREFLLAQRIIRDRGDDQP